MSDQVTSYIRTLVPLLVGAVVAYLTEKGISVPDSLISLVTGLLTTGFGILYYVIVRKLESKWPKLGWLLGVPKEPTY